MTGITLGVFVEVVLVIILSGCERTSLRNGGHNRTCPLLIRLYFFNHFDGSLYILPEQLGMHLNSDTSQTDAKAKHLAVLFRANPLSQLASDEIAVPVATLLAESASSYKPLFMDIIHHQTQADGLDHAMEFLATYADTLLRGTLSLYFKYGIAEFIVVLFD